MSAPAWFAIFGSVLVGVVVRVSNIVVAALAKVLGVAPPEPIPTPEEHGAVGPRAASTEPRSGHS